MTTAPLHPEITIHVDNSGDWAFVTEGDQTIDEGHFDDVADRLLDRLVARREITVIDRNFKQRLARPATSIPASEIFAMEIQP